MMFIWSSNQTSFFSKSGKKKFLNVTRYHVDKYGTKSGGINSDSYVYSNEKNMLIVIPVILVHNICYVVVTSLHTMYYCTEYAYMITDENRFLLLQIKIKFYVLNNVS